MRVQIEKECENGFPSTINFIRHRKIHTIDAKCKLFTANSYTPISFHTAPEIPSIKNNIAATVLIAVSKNAIPKGIFVFFRKSFLTCLLVST